MGENAARGRLWSAGRANGGAPPRGEEVEPIAALEHAHHRRRSDALTQQRGPARHVLGLEREAAERVAVERVEPGEYQQQVGRPPLQGGVHRSEEIARVHLPRQPRRAWDVEHVTYPALVPGTR